MIQLRGSTDITYHDAYGEGLEEVAGNMQIPCTNGSGQNPYNVILNFTAKLPFLPMRTRRYYKRLSRASRQRINHNFFMRLFSYI